MLDFQTTDNQKLIVVVCSDGKVMIDRRVYEQKLGTLLSCKTKKEVYQLATDSYDYIKEHYGNKKIYRPKIIL